MCPGGPPPRLAIGGNPSKQEYKSEALQGGHPRLPAPPAPRLTMQRDGRLWPPLAAVPSYRTNQHSLLLGFDQSRQKLSKSISCSPDQFMKMFSSQPAPGGVLPVSFAVFSGRPENMLLHQSVHPDTSTVVASACRNDVVVKLSFRQVWGKRARSPHQ